MIVTFLGTGTSQGVPVIACDCEVCKSIDYRDKRLRSSVHIQVEGKSIIIDTGPDFRQQVLRERIELLDAILFTHEHKDHIAGMDDVRGFNFKLKKNIPIFAAERVINNLEKEYAYVFAHDPFFLDDLKIIPIKVLHHKLPVWGFRINDFSYVTDAKYIPLEEKGKLTGSKVLVVNALRKKEHISHFTLQEALGLIEEIKPEKAYLIHLSHQMGFHKEVSQELPDHVEIAYDGLKVKV